MQSLLAAVIGATLLVFGPAAFAQDAKFSHAQVCRAAVAVVMARDPKIVKVDRADGEVLHLSYVRPDDAKRWTYRCKLEGQRVVWASAEGRWRLHPDDGIVLYSTAGSSLTIEERFTDGSKSTKTFSSQQLAN